MIIRTGLRAHFVVFVFLHSRRINLSLAADDIGEITEGEKCITSDNLHVSDC